MAHESSWLGENGDAPVALSARPATAPATPAPTKGEGEAEADHAVKARTTQAVESPPPPPAATRPTSAAVTDDRMLRPQSRPPEGGWRRAVYRASFGLLNPGPGKAELRRRELVAALKTPVPGSRTIAAISTKGGVGKTTTAYMLASTFAAWRGDRVVGLDGNPDAGSLGRRLRRETTATASQLLADRHRIERYSDIRAYSSQAASRAEIIAADSDPRISQALGEAEYQELIELLAHHYNLIVVDCGTGILDSANQGIVRAADQLVVVTGVSVDGAWATSYVLDWLIEHGHADLVADAVAVINAVPAERGLVDVDQLAEHFAGRCRAVVRVPWDSVLAAGAETDPEQLKPATRDAYMELAAAVAGGFATRTEEEVVS